MGVLLVSQSKLKAFSEINANTDVELLLPGIQIAQDYLQQTIGTKFYKHLLSAVSGGTLNSDETLLLEDYIQPILIHRGYYEVLPSIWVRTMNKGLIKGDTEQGSSVDSGTLNYLRNIQRNRFEWYEQRMLDYLNNHEELYPQYNNYTSKDGLPPNKDKPYFSGVVIPNAARKGYKYGKRANRPDDYDNCFDC